MDLISYIPGVGPTKLFSPGPDTPAPFNVNHTGATDGTGPGTASSNMAEIYNRILLDIDAVKVAAGLTIDRNNWTQLQQAVSAIAQQLVNAALGSGLVTQAQYNADFASSVPNTLHLKGGFLLQWGRVYGVDIHGGADVTFPIAFPTQILYADCSHMNPVNYGPDVTGGLAHVNGNVGLHIDGGAKFGSSGGTTNMGWWAWGN